MHLVLHLTLTKVIEIARLRKVACLNLRDVTIKWIVTQRLVTTLQVVIKLRIITVLYTEGNINISTPKTEQASVRFYWYLAFVTVLSLQEFTKHETKGYEQRVIFCLHFSACLYIYTDGQKGFCLAIATKGAGVVILWVVFSCDVFICMQFHSLGIIVFYYYCEQFPRTTV